MLVLRRAAYGAAITSEPHIASSLVKRQLIKGSVGLDGRQGACAETQFKKGERSGVAVRLWKPIGTERVSKDGYLERKVNNGLPVQARWRAVHLVVWEAAHGHVPRGHAVIFLNGDKTDIRLDNFECISRRALMARNSVHNLPAPVASAVQLLGALKRQIHRRDSR